MDTYEQYTVYVSKDASPQSQKKFDWAEVPHRLKQSNKPFLVFGYTSLLGGAIYLMSSIFSSATDPALPVKIFSWALLSCGALFLSMKDVDQFETVAGEHYRTTSADDIRATVKQTGIDVKTTKDLFRLLELGESSLFNDIRKHTLATLRPRRDKDINQVKKFFDTIQYCYENAQKTLPHDVKVNVEINGRSYPKTSGSYINSLYGTQYGSANIYLSWLSK